MTMPDPYGAFQAYWRAKSTKQIERELASWRRRMDKYSSAYAWHGTGITPPGSLADGDKVSALRAILDERQEHDDPGARPEEGR